MAGRLPWIDVGRGAALVAMAAYHFTWDLADFNWIAAGVTSSPLFHVIGHMIAASFLTLSGASLVLAQRARGPLWRDARYWRRWGQIAAAAGGISALTFWLFPQAPIFFGILHCIALASLLALPLVEARPAATLGVAALALVAPKLLSSTIFDVKLLWWTGLSTFSPASNDYRPLLPWLGFVLIGVAAAHLILPARRGGALAPPPVLRPFAYLGRHSLAFYLIHQPVLFGALSLIALFAASAPDEAAFAGQCIAQCSSSGVAATICERSCACVADRAKNAGRWPALLGNSLDAGQKAATHDDAVACYAEAAGK
jgi:uncharacterized membrane protein